MEVHDNTAHIKLNENSIVSFMGNDGEGSIAALPSAPLRARYSEDCREKFRAKRDCRFRGASGRTTLGVPGEWRCGWEHGCTILGTPRAWRYGE